MDEHIKVVVQGALGRMGREVLAALCREEGLEPVGAADQVASEEHLSLPDGSGHIPCARDLAQVLERVRPHVVVDFTNAEAGLYAIRACARHKVNVVSGSTGWSDAALEEARTLVQETGIGALVAPNFALGAVLLIHLARLVGRFFDYADVLEAHHETKADAPSGTALAIARAVTQGGQKSFHRPLPTKEPLPGTRGGEFQGVSVHSVRMPGRMAHHELILGTTGQTLSLRHDTINRECYVPGILLGIRHVLAHPGLVVGLENILGL